MGLGRPRDAVEVLKQLQGAAEPRRASRLQPRHRAARGQADEQDAIEQLDRPGRSASGDDARPRDPRQVEPRARHAAVRVRPIRCARSSLFDRVRLDGPFSNQALLALGLGRGVGRALRASAWFRGASSRSASTTDAAVQEAMLALPYRLRQARRARPRGAAVRERARFVRRARSSKRGRSIDEHPRRQVPEGAGPRGDQARTRTGSSACARCPSRRRRTT